MLAGVKSGLGRHWATAPHGVSPSESAKPSDGRRDLAGMAALAPLFLVLVLGKLGLCLFRTAGLGELPVNLALALVSEAAFVVAASAATAACSGASGSGGGGGAPRRDEASGKPVAAAARHLAAAVSQRRGGCCQRHGGLGLRRLLLPGLQVLAIADFIYIALVGIPLRLRLVVFFLTNLFSDYVQQILFIYVGVGVPLLVAFLLVTLALANHAAARLAAALQEQAQSLPPLALKGPL